MSVSRLTHITKIGVEQMGDLADSLKDSEVLRLENLDTDLRPPPSALAFTKRAVDEDDANSYLPFFGLEVMRQAAANLVRRQSGQQYDWKTECVISAGGLSGILNVLLATLEPGDEVLMKEYRMIGWRVGWVVGPADIIADVGRVSISNVVCQTRIAMGAVATAINDPNDGLPACVAEWQRRRDVLLEELREFTVIPPHGGWSLFLDVSPLGLDSATASKRLLESGRIAATPMVNWGSANTNKDVRFVFANEPVHRLCGVANRVKQTLT